MASSESSLRRQQSEANAFLKALSEACDHHQQNRHSEGIRSAFDQHIENVPCCQELSKFRELLAKVEAETFRTTVALDLVHICQFYRNVLQGIFCPYALHIFDCGRGGTEIVPRVVRLLEHALDPTVSNKPHVLNTLIQTMADLLAHVPEHSIQIQILQYLVQMTSDASIILEQSMEQAEMQVFGRHVLTITLPQAWALLTISWGILYHVVQKVEQQRRKSLDEVLVVVEQDCCVQPLHFQVDAELLENLLDYRVVDRRERALLVQAKEYAMQLAQKDSRPAVARAVAKAAVNVLRDERVLSYATCVAKMLSRLANEHSSIIMPSLLESLEYMSAEQPQEDDQGRLLDDRVLEPVILRILSIRSHRTLPVQLIDLLHDPLLASRASVIVGDFLRNCSTTRKQEIEHMYSEHTEMGDREARPLSANPSKRQKTDRAVVLRVDGALAEFLVSARESAFRIREALPNIDSTHITDVVTVTSAIVILVNGFGDEMASLQTDLLKCALELTKAVSGTENIVPSPLLTFCVECGINLQAELTPPRDDVICNEVLNFKNEVEQAYTSLCFATDSFLVPRLRGVFLADLAFGPNRELIELFPSIKLSFKDKNRDDLCPRVVQGFDFAFTELSIDDDVQRSRLLLLEKMTGTTLFPEHHGKFILREATLASSKLILDSHSDPCIRLTLWQCLGYLMLSTDPSVLRDLVPSMVCSSSSSQSPVTPGSELLSWLMEVAFADPSIFVRDYASNELGKVVSAHQGRGLNALLANQTEWEKLQEQDNRNADRYDAWNNVAEHILEILDNLLHEHCDMPLSHHSSACSGGIALPGKVQEDERSLDGLLVRIRSTVRALAFLSAAKELEHEFARFFVEYPLRRILGLCWGNTSSHRRLEFFGLCFGELFILQRSFDLHQAIRESCQVPLAAEAHRSIVQMSMFCARPASVSMPIAHWERQFRWMCAFVLRFLSPITESTNIIVEVEKADSILKGILPGIAATYVTEKDYDALTSVTAMKRFIDVTKQLNEKRRERENSHGMPGQSAYDLHIGFDKPSKARRLKWSSDWGSKTRDLCLIGAYVERIIPSILLRDKEELYFFTKTVLKGSPSLGQIVSNAEQAVLKGLLREISRCPRFSLDSVVQTIGRAAMVRNSFATSLSSSSDDKSSSVAASEWMTQHFMYLLVSFVQPNWGAQSTSTALDKLQALTSLSLMLRLLLPSEASQYIPQVLATVNAAIADGLDDSKTKRKDLNAEVAVRALEILAQLVKLVGNHNWEPLGQNLTPIVVSLIPILSIEEKVGYTKEIRHTMAKTVAVDLLNYLSKSELGEKLAPFFKEIPFLPSLPELDPMRAALHSNGVDFESLQIVIDAQGPQNDSHIRASCCTSDGSLSSDKNHIETSKRQAALRRRLEMVCSLLANESASVRRVTLQHLTHLLRSNRDIYHALVENEGTTSMKRYLTIAYSGQGQSRGTITSVVERLLSRCVHEMDPVARVLLATCIGEVGAIDTLRLEETTSALSKTSDAIDAYHAWRLSNPPWQSNPVRYELQLVTKLLFVAFKAATTSTDQHRVGFTIQQLLVLLDDSANQGLAAQCGPNGGPEADSKVNAASKREMSPWLDKTLKEAEVFDVVEPFWHTQFREAQEFTPLHPPYFEGAVSCSKWMCNWCRHMIHRARSKNITKWSDLFYACRTAIRTEAGQSIAEFLLPVLVLDRLCHGDTEDERVIMKELKDALSFSTSNAYMSISERQKAVSVVFSVIDTLELWAEDEIEHRHKECGGTLSKETVKSEDLESKLPGDQWPRDESVMRIEDLLHAVPLSLRAHAAEKVGMYARALRLLEMEARKAVASAIFDGMGKCDEVEPGRSRAAGQCPPTALSLMKDVLASLQDYETMTALSHIYVQTDPLLSAKDSIRQKEANQDFEGALQDYERALQLRGNAQGDDSLQRGVLRCLLELDQFESVLNQSRGLMHTDSFSPINDSVLSFATEAAWRLGRWDTLSELVEDNNDIHLDHETQYQLSFGRVMLGIKENNQKLVVDELTQARGAIMVGLSSCARESYSRAYEYVVRLQILREVEDAYPDLCSGSPIDLTDLVSRWGWARRLDLLSPNGVSTVIRTRIALSRLGNDKSLESSLFLNLGRRARKHCLHNIAANSFAQAESALLSRASERQGILERSALRVQVAKLKHGLGDSTDALRLLGMDSAEKISGLETGQLRSEVARHVCLMLQAEPDALQESELIEVYARSMLLSTCWMIEGGLKGASEIVGRFRLIHQISPKWEKGHFKFGKYIDTVIESRIDGLQRRSPETYAAADEQESRNRCLALDRTSQRYILLAAKHYAESLSIDTKHVYQALPRLLTLWFDFTAVKPEGAVADSLTEVQQDANEFMSLQIKRIPAQAFYTAIPQLISNVTHKDKDTSLVVRSILSRVLTKFPAQAMWPLAWLRQSRHPERKNVGEGIFLDAERTLTKNNQRGRKLLVASKSIFEYLQQLAKLEVKDNARQVKVSPWKGEVSLIEFVPPIQAALSISLATGDSSRSRELFPRQVPRMRMFNPYISVMASKAKPKKLKVFVVSADTCVNSASTGKRDQKRSDLDIGEIHFLVKQEAKGDLRKDARVQDMNGMINRLMSSSKASRRAAKHNRRLCLRTFEVTCLSEDTGILEWVPNTDSLRSLVSQAYNPQASPFSSKRRGRRLANFGEPMLRTNFERKCQSMYFDSGNLKRAAAMFEELCLKPYPPLLYWWFVQHFHDPHVWYEARNRFTLSAAAWSAVGHVIGLGDRHSENILVDTTTGECVHVDFDCIFDKGIHLPRPETVPFRLTQNMVDAFGPTGVDGVYTSGLNTAMGILRDNRDTLLSVLEPFVKDPIIDWRRYRSQQKSSRQAISTDDRQTQEAKRSISVIDERLRGIYNLKNPNHQKIRRTDGVDHQDDELTHLVPLSVEGQVHKMIAEATSHENLVQLYVGWMPWV